MSTTTFFRFGIKTAVGVLVTGVLMAPTFAENKAHNSVAVTVGDLGNPFFVQIAHGAEAKAKEINPNVKFTALSGPKRVRQPRWEHPGHERLVEGLR